MSNIFKISATCGKARCGKLHLRRMNVKTPFFMPVATNSCVKHISPKELDASGTEALISNSFILSLRPGVDIIESSGGLNRFMSWSQAIFKDCGGFQMLRRGFLKSITDKGILFRNPFNGSRVQVTPQSTILNHLRIGGNVAMALDDVVGVGATRKRYAQAVRRTLMFAEQSIQHFKDLSPSYPPQLLFGIAQGGVHPDLRIKSAKSVDSLGFDGVAIGGLAIGEEKSITRSMIKASLSAIDPSKPRYLMGVGHPSDIIDAVMQGVDCFDSIFPTQNARHGRIFTRFGFYRINSPLNANSTSPLENGCKCPACTHYSRSYIHHLFKAGESLGLRLASLHNIYFMQKLIADIRALIRENNLSEIYILYPGISGNSLSTTKGTQKFHH